MIKNISLILSLLAVTTNSLFAQQIKSTIVNTGYVKNSQNKLPLNNKFYDLNDSTIVLEFRRSKNGFNRDDIVALFFDKNTLNIRDSIVLWERSSQITTSYNYNSPFG